ncbi:hypothetical protein GGG16DRAFT_118376 [Schizophyllum commune]
MDSAAQPCRMLRLWPCAWFYQPSEGTYDDLLEVTLWNLNQVNIVNTSPPSSTAHIHKLFTREGYRESLEARRRWHEMCDGEDESAQKWKSD